MIYYNLLAKNDIRLSRCSNKKKLKKYLDPLIFYYVLNRYGIQHFYKKNTIINFGIGSCPPCPCARTTNDNNLMMVP